MKDTGYTVERDRAHEQELITVMNFLHARGYKPELLETKGHRPDLLLRAREYVDVKTGHPNIAIEIDSWNEYRRIETVERGRVYIVWRSKGGVLLVFTTCTLTGGIRGGPRRRSGNGSNDDWYLICPIGRGVAFDTFFPAI